MVETPHTGEGDLKKKKKKEKNYKLGNLILPKSKRGHLYSKIGEFSILSLIFGISVLVKEREREREREKQRKMRKKR